MTAPPDNSAPTNRRAFLAGAAAAVAAPTALAVLGAASPASAGVAPGCPSPGYAPVPPSALGPALNADGYFAGQINGNLYWVTDSFYQAMFLTTHDGVILVDAPPTIGHNLLRAIDAITSANGMPSTVTHLVYSHSHADHIGASSLFSADVVRIGHVENLRLLRRDDDPSRPPPTVTFEDRYVLEVGGEVLELAYHGPNVTPDNIFIHAPAHQTLMVVDILFPGWVPFKSLAIAQDIPGWIGAQDVAMSYPWTTLVGGHLGRLGTRADGLAQIQYIADLQASTRAAIASVDPTPSSTSTRRTPGRSSRPTSTPSPPKPPARSSPNTPECSPPPTSTPSSTPRQCSTRSGSTPATWDPSAITRRPGHPRTNHMRFAAKCGKNPATEKPEGPQCRRQHRGLYRGAVGHRAQADSGVRRVAVRTQIPASILQTGSLIVLSHLRKELSNMLTSILGAQLSWHFADGWVFEPAAVGPDMVEYSLKEGPHAGRHAIQHFYYQRVAPGVETTAWYEESGAVVHMTWYLQTQTVHRFAALPAWLAEDMTVYRGDNQALAFIEKIKELISQGPDWPRRILNDDGYFKVI